MALTPEQLKVLESIRVEWNRAEEDIKLAEQVCNEIVFPSINELRYGGRRVVEILHGVITGAPQDQIDALLADARFDCHRARHDAIDTATSKIAIHIENMTERLQYEAILPAYGKFPSFVGHLADIRKRVSISRKDRENRDAIYAVIEKDDFPGLVDQYRELCACEPIMRKLAMRNRWRDFLGFWGFIFGGIGIAVGIIGVWLAFHPPLSASPVAAPSTKTVSSPSR